MNREELIQEIKAIITSNKTPKIIREQLEDYHENDIAQAMQYLDVKDRKKLYRIATVTMLADFSSTCTLRFYLCMFIISNRT